MSAAPTPTGLNDPALHNRTIRQNIRDVYNSSVFRGGERAATEQSIKHCDNPEQLQRWLRNMRRLRDEREQQLHQACEDGQFVTGLSLD
jgi:hypothetical protein